MLRGRPRLTDEERAEQRGRKKEQRQRHTAKMLPRKRELLERLKAAPCMDCETSFPSECMHFDHRPGETKLFNISARANRMTPRLEAELAKCDLVCANCHAIRTRRRHYE